MVHCPKTIARTIVCSGIFLTAGLCSALAADPTGDWKVADGVANIRVAQCSGNMWGVVAWEQTPGGKDKNNPDASKQSRPTLGMPILIDMKKKPGGDAWEGQVYNAKDGQLYSSSIKPVGTDQLEIQGCVLGFLCGGETWTRVGPPIPSSPANNMAKGAPKSQPGSHTSKTTGTANPAPKAAAPKAAAPKTAAASKTAPGQKQAAGQPGDIGDICLLPDIARFAH
jgi:uncharacterized protein (DUF2147 family)